MGKKEKKPFKMPHLLWIMFGIIVLACLATYLIPAGEFAVNEAGQITGTDFHFLGHQTPVSPWGALMRVKSGMVGAATIAFVVMISGANINVVLETGVMDDLMNWGVYKLKDKGTGILVSMMMILMAYLGGFGGDSFGHDEAGVQTAGYVYRFGMHSFKSCKAGNGGRRSRCGYFRRCIEGG